LYKKIKKLYGMLYDVCWKTTLLSRSKYLQQVITKQIVFTQTLG